MNLAVYCFVILIIGMSAHAQPLADSIRKLSSLEKDAAQWNETEFLQTSDQALQSWNSAPREEKTRYAYNMFLVHFRRAEIRAASGDFVGAAIELGEEGKLQGNFGGRLEYATKSPNAFFQRLARLQTEIASKTDSDPLARIVNYLFQKNGDEYIVARQELDPEVNGVTIDGVSKSESVVQALYFNAQEGKVTLENTRWFIGPKGNVADTLNHATREVLQDQYGRYVTGPLRGTVLSNTGQEDHITASAQSTPVPQLAIPVQQTKAMAQTTPSPILKAQTPHSSSFPILPVAIVVALILGIVLLILRRKSK